MDLTAFLATTQKGSQEEGLEAIDLAGRVAVAAKGRFMRRALCRALEGYSRMTCAVTDQDVCLNDLEAEADDP
jgi:hypothetical protein